MQPLPDRHSAPAVDSACGLLIPVLLALAVLLAYWPACGGQFTLWDDQGVIAHEPTLLPPTWNSLVAWWSRPILYLYIPVSYSIWGLIALIAKRPAEMGWALIPAPFHIANLILHMLATIVAYRLLLALVNSRWPAAAGAALFALHPVQVETVAWAMGLRDLLCGLFTLIALWQFVRANRRGGGGRWRFGIATAAYACALLSKPSAVMVPLLAAALAMAAEPRMHLRAFAARQRGLIGRIGLWIAMAIPIALIARHNQPSYRLSEFVPLMHRPMVALDSIAFYVGKIFWPARLYMDYGRSPAYIFATGQARWTWMIPAAIAAILLIAARRRPLVLAGAAISVLALTPVLGFVGFDFESYSTVADRFLYVPMIGVALIAAALLTLLERPVRSRESASAGSARDRRLASQPMRNPHVLLPSVIVCILLGLLAWKSFLQTWVWHDTDTLFSHAQRFNPLGAATNDTLARAALDAGDGELAETYARRSICGSPWRSQGYLLLAAALRQQKRGREALAAAQSAYRIEPNDPDVAIGLAAILDDADRHAESAELYRKAIALDPTLPEVHLGFAIHLVNSGQRSAAIAELRKAAALARYDPATLSQIGEAFADAGDIADARSAYESALRLQKNFGPAYMGLFDLPLKEK